MNQQEKPRLGSYAHITAQELTHKLFLKAQAYFEDIYPRLSNIELMVVYLDKKLEQHRTPEPIMERSEKEELEAARLILRGIVDKVQELKKEAQRI